MASPASNDLKRLKDALKTWERQFAKTHDGRKPSREDIKADPAIAAEYKMYNNLTKHAASIKAPKEHSTPSKKRKTAHSSQFTPQRRGTTLETRTPERRQAQAQAVEEPAWAAEEGSSHPKQPTLNVIGPTPNKDGRVMGLFDSMPSATPNNRRRSALTEVDGNIAQTPSKCPEPSIPSSASPAKLGRTPQSSGKRFMLDAFVTTPSKRLRLDADTPTSSRQLNTPSLARRRTEGMPTLAEEASPMKVQPFTRRSFGRSLSSMIREMKQQQEKDMDAELELLHEMEAAVSGGNPTAPRPMKPVEKVAETQFEAFEEDAMAALEELERQEQATGETPAEITNQPQKVWKKKGLKRQTKRVIMRPVARKPHPAGMLGEATTEDPHSSRDEGSDGELAWSEEEAEAKSQTRSHVTSEMSKPQAKARKGTGTINPNAAVHANFRSLKIKNKNSKAKGRGRFGRRR